MSLVQLLDLKRTKGEIVRDKKSGQWGVSTHMGGTFLDL